MGKVGHTHCTWRNLVWAIAVLVITVTPTFTPTSVYAQDQGPVFNEGFEGDFKADPYCKTGTCNVPAGWGVWFIPRRETDQPGINFQPLYVQTKIANRVKSGSASQRIYVENATFTGGIYRIVADVKVGSKLRFSAWGQSWSTNDESPISARPSPDIKLKIGIDPMGGNNGQASPLNGQVTWSEEHDAKDAFTQFSVETEAKTSTVIVYLYSTMADPVRHNEVFWDDAVLEYTSPPATATVSATIEAANPITTTASTTGTLTADASASGTPGPTSAAPAIQATGGTTYTVVEGDTLFAIALKYNKSVEEIKRLNGMSSDLLSIGQVLIIDPPTQPAAGTPAIQPTAIVSATATPTTGALCVQAFFDNNGDGQRDTGEELVPNVLFKVTTKGNAVTSYTTDGVNEPYCIRNLSAGDYTVAATVVADYVPTTPLNDTASVPGGAAAKFSVGLRKASDGNQIVGVTGTAMPNAATGSGGPSVLAILATLGGGLIILGSIGFGVLFFMQSRRL
jgi:LysM repeat protein